MPVREREEQDGGVRSVPKSTLRKVINEAVERAFIAGAEWAMIRSGVDSAKANRQVNTWRKQQTPPSLPIVQQTCREQIARAIFDAAIHSDK